MSTDTAGNSTYLLHTKHCCVLHAGKQGGAAMHSNITTATSSSNQADNPKAQGEHP
jgi:hypothetical protein